MAVFMDIKGTSQLYFQISKGGPKIFNESGSLALKNSAGTSYADFYAAILNAAGDGIVLNSDATQSGADWKIAINRPTSGMTANLTFTLPPDAGTNGYVLQTNGSGVLTWVAQAVAPSVAAKVGTETISFAYNSGAGPTSIFTLPANAVVHKVQVIIDTVFNNGAEIAISGDAIIGKYMYYTENSLTSGAGDIWETNPSQIPLGTTEDINYSYTQGGATQGAGRILVYYSIPA